MNARRSINRLLLQIRTLQGDPHYIALGMAIGVFTALTPTVPLQTLIAVTMALICNASKPAAVIGTLTANPVTLPVFYLGSFKIGRLLLGDSSIPAAMPHASIPALLKLGGGVTLAVMTGGVVLGLVPGLVTYLVTLRFFKTLRARLKGRQPNPEIESE